MAKEGGLPIRNRGIQCLPRKKHCNNQGDGWNTFVSGRKKIIYVNRESSAKIKIIDICWKY